MVVHMNQRHLDLLVSDDWRMLLRDYLLPFAFGDRSHGDLGDDVLEIGPGPGLTTDLVRGDLVKLTAIEVDPELASALSARLRGTNVDVVEGDATAMPFDTARFTGAMTFTMLHHVPTVELQDRLFGEIFRVLRPGGLLVASDSVASEDLAALHTDDIYNPVDPSTLSDRLGTIGFADVEVEANSLGWRCQARRRR
jgi:SAM-dependent methyltransferase